MPSTKRRRQRHNRRLATLTEAATATGTVTEVRSDLTPIAAEAAIRSDGTIAVCLITPGWGSSGYYSPEVLEQAAADGVYPAGTQMFWDHPTVTEGSERPERSLRDLAAVLKTGAVWQPDHPQGPGLYAQARPFPPYRDLLAEMAPHIGVSIRAAAEVGQGEADGRRGRIVHRIVEGPSVDFVTKPGRGGKILEVFESAGRTDLVDLLEARNVGEWFQSRIHLDFTQRADEMFGDGRLTKTERITLSSGIGAALDAFSQVVDEQAPQLLTRDLWDEPSPPEQPINESEEDDVNKQELMEAMAEVIKPIADRITKLEEATEPPAGADGTEELSEAQKADRDRADRAEGALLIREASDRVAADQKVQGLPKVARDRLIAAVASEATRTDDGKLDVAALDEATKTAVDAEVKYLTEATGGRITGMGDTGPAITEDLDEALAVVFQDLGLSESAAKIAAAGRGA